MDVTLASLRAFTEVAERESIRAAADSLGYTPSAISQRLSALENALGVQLFERLGNRIAVTTSGDRIRKQAIAVLTSVDNLERLASDVDLGSQPRRKVVLGGFPSGVQLLVPALLGELRQAGIDLQLVTLEDHAGEIDLRLGHLDVLLMQEYSVRKEMKDEFSYRLLVEEPLVLIVPPAHRASGDGLDGIESAADSRWILPSTQTTCGVGVRVLCRSAGFEPRIVATIDDFGLQKQLVQAGYGVAVMPESCAREEESLNMAASQPKMSTIPVNGSRSITATTRRTSADDLAVQSVLELLSNEPLPILT